MPNDDSFVKNSEDQPVKKSLSQGFVRLPKNIIQEFKGNYALLGIYTMILGEVSWGSHIVSLRKKQPVEPNELVTTLSRLVELLGMDKRRVKRELAVLSEMGALLVEERSKHCLVITNTKRVTKNALMAASEIPTARSVKSGKCPQAGKNEKWQMPLLDETKGGKCHYSEKQKVANATIRTPPSLLEKKKKKYKEQQREEEKPQSPETSANAPVFSSPPVVGLKVVNGPPKSFTAKPVHKDLVEGWMEHMRMNSPTKGTQIARDNYEYWMELLLRQAGRGLTPEVDECSLLCFFKFLAHKSDACKEWPGWGAVLLSIPEAVRRRDGVSKFDKAWSVFRVTYEKQKTDYIERQRTEAQRAAERAMGLNLPF